MIQVSSFFYKFDVCKRKKKNNDTQSIPKTQSDENRTYYAYNKKTIGITT